jgi:curved DNA-binding protein CbpA
MSKQISVTLLLFLSVSLLLAFAFPQNSRLYKVANRLSCSSLVRKAAENVGDSSSIRPSRQTHHREVTLYDLLGASPKDTPEQLKRRYTALVRSLHPDLNRNTNDDNNKKNNKVKGGFDLSEINAAWEILGDKKARLRYDRSLQAKEFTEGVEALVGLGIQSAIPWLKKTADTTVAAVDATAAAMDASARAAQEGAEQAKFAYGIFELEQKSRSLEQRAVAEQAKADRVQKEMENLPSKRISFLRHDIIIKDNAISANAPNNLLTYVEAQGILKNFQVEVASSGLSADLDTLYDIEQEHRASIKSRQAMERTCLMATRKLDQAQLAEIQAQKRLEEAQRALMEAQQKHVQAQQACTNALTEESDSHKIVQKIEQMLYKTQQKVKSGLYQQQEMYLDFRARELKFEKANLETSAKNLRAEAVALKNEALRLERSNKF